MGAVLAGHYHIVRPLGSGGFGQTFLAQDSHLPGQPLCVVKQFKPRYQAAESLQAAKRLFNLEAETLYRLGNHDQIPRLLAHFEQDGEFYLVQEYVEGWSLEEEFDRRQRLNEVEVLTLLQDLLQVLVFVHQQRVIHRDIKPSNLLRRKRDRKIVLIDFGAVKQVSAQHLDGSGQTSLTVAIGSPGYMPVEQQSSLPQFSSDIYAVGMVALQALSGKAPREFPKDDRTGEISCAHLGIRVSAELAHVLDTMVRYDYRHRYLNAVEALQALQTLPTFFPASSSPQREAGAIFDVPLTQITHTLVQSANSIAPDQLETQPPSSEPRLIQSLPQLARTPLSEKRDRALGDPPVSQPPVSTPLSRQEYRNRQALLSKVNHYWVKGVLEASLHDQVLLILGLETRLDAVTSPWNVTWQTSQQSTTTLPQGTHIISIFDQLGTGRTLLILGEPGAGKTTTLLQLARDLIIRAEQDVNHLIPVVLNLSSWSEEKSIATWITEELNAKYQVPHKISQPWVEQQHLLLLLDGLDEVRAESREACVDALNAFQQEYSTEMVVCSRLQDYEAMTNRLHFESAVYLRSLTPAQIHSYLDSLKGDLAGLKTLLAEDPALQELARSPLMLNIMVLAYQGVSADDLDETLLIEERRRHLFNAYIERTFRRRGDRRYSQQQAIYWLSWLAKQLIQHSQTMFLIEQLQPTWLQTRSQKITYRLGVVFMGIMMGAPFGIITGAATNGIMVGWRSGLLKGLVNSLIYGFAFGLIAGLSKPGIETVETLKWSWREARKNLIVGLKNGLPLGFIAGLLFGSISQLFPNITPGAVHQVVSNGLILGIAGGVFSGAIGGIIYGLTHGLRGSTIEIKTRPNQGIRRTLLSAGIGGLIGASIDTLIVTLVFGSILGIGFGLMYGLSYGLFGGLIAGFIFGGGQACFKHLILRLILYRNGYIPWNYARFLDYATEHAFLQRVGGGYIFIHRLLLEHFAQMQD